MATISKAHPIDLNKFTYPLIHTMILVPLAFFTLLTGIYLLHLIPDMNMQGLLGTTGTAAMLTFGAMLACTPVSIITGWQRPRRLRKPFGLYAFAFATIHYIAFIDHEGTLQKALAAITADGLALFGFLGLALMVPLAATSTRWAIRKLRKNWQYLHRLTYVAAVFIAVHLLLVGEGIGAIYLVLLAIRVPRMKHAIIAVRKKYQADRKQAARNNA